MASLRDACSAVFNDIEGMVGQVLEEISKVASNHKEDVARLRRELAELDQLSSGIARLMVNPSLSPGTLAELNLQLDQIAAKRATLKTGLDRLLDNANDDLEQMARRVRTRLEQAREQWESAGSPAALNSLVAEFIGPSLVTREGKLLPVPTRNPVPEAEASVHGVVTPRGFEPLLPP